MLQDYQKLMIPLLVLASLALGGWLMLKLSPALVPFVIAAFIAYLVDPLVEVLCSSKRIKIPRTLAVSFIFLLLSVVLFVLVIYLVPLFNQQLRDLLQALPAGVKWLQTSVLPKLQNLGFEADLSDFKVLQEALTVHWSKASTAASFMGKWLFHSGLAVVHWSINLFIILVAAFYLLRDWHKVIAGVQSLLPLTARERILSVFKKSDQVMGAFLRGQLLVMCALAVLYAIGLAVVGVKFALILGLVAGLLSIVPYLGAISGLVATVIVALIQSHDYSLLAGVGLVFAIGHVVEGMILTPLLLGDKLGLHPLAVIFAVMAGGQLFGLVGVLLAIPLAAILVVVLREPMLQWAKGH